MKKIVLRVLLENKINIKHTHCLLKQRIVATMFVTSAATNSHLPEGRIFGYSAVNTKLIFV